jgi:predicted DNA-binding transcriptional regulator YafY
MTKIEAAVPQALRQVVLDTALFAPGIPWAAAMARDMALLRRAIGEHRRISFDYTRSDGERTERSVRPLGMYFWGSKWTLAAWCELRRDYRSFRPDRMEGVELLNETFDEGDGVSLEDFLARTGGEGAERA